MHKRRKQQKRKMIRKVIILVCSFIFFLAVLVCVKNIDKKEQTSVEDAIETEIREEAETSIDEDSVSLSDEKEDNRENEPASTELSDTTEPFNAEGEESAKLEREVMERLSEMTLEEKVAQMFMITPEALTGYSQVTAAGDVTYQALKEYPVGGIIYFASNIIEPKQLKEMTQNMQEYAVEISGIPMFLGIDEEGGMVTRIARNNAFEVERFPNMWEIGKSGDLEYAYYVGETIGAYLKDSGLNVDFAPDADVLTNSGNKVIGERAFSDDAVLTAEMSVKVMQGLEAQSVYACMKHFPGHGGTVGDTHQGYAYTERTIEELRQEELVPFQYGIENGISFIMVSHIALPNVIGDETPASTSKHIVTDILRDEMGYEGIVITDAMNMGAVTTCYNSADGAVAAVLAGVDIVLMPSNFKAAYQGVIDAVANGEIQEERIDESVKRILRVKIEMMKNAEETMEQP